MAKVLFIDGSWCVVQGDSVTKCQSNAHAWREADKLNMEPHNRKEAAHEWSSRAND